eukprot:TRINITY_DN9424_c0_g1_i1.p1 TRINITY_DN9424_c0_g1~~TRINITY_DN9424_c0_g1_i1.p1  ORF type:complete len:153 (+),score=25.86 TRINITY_DN9424_c0_g1_i1:22-480(+)
MVLPLIAALSFSIAAGGLVYRSVVRHGGIRNAASHAAYRAGIIRNPPIQKVEPSPSTADVDGTNDLLEEFEKNPYFTGGFEDVMTPTEACLVLAISEEDAADPKKIQLSHRKVILLNHPDYGGSAYIASKINEAKEVLENQLEQTKKNKESE